MRARSGPQAVQNLLKHELREYEAAAGGGSTPSKGGPILACPEAVARLQKRKALPPP
jgi:hypothetical protein